MDEYDRGQTREMADTLGAMAMELMKMSGEEEAFTESLRAGWRGENADLFLKKYEEVREDLLQTAKELLDTSEKVRDILR